MAAWTLVASAIASSVAAAILIGLGARLRQRHAEPKRRLAARAFGSTWILLGLVAVTNAITTLAALANVASLTLVIASRFASLSFITAALAALSFYLVYIHNGNVKAYFPVAAGYAGLLIAGWFAIAAARPIGVVVGNWYIEPMFATDAVPRIYALFTLGLTLTPILVITSYLSLMRHTSEPAARRRIQVVSYGLLAWLVSGAVTRVMNDELAFFASRTLLGILVGAAVWFVHFPPAWAASRYDLTPLSLRPERPPADPMAFTRRVNDLV